VRQHDRALDVPVAAVGRRVALHRRELGERLEAVLAHEARGVRRVAGSGIVWRPGIVVTASHMLRRSDDSEIALDSRADFLAKPSPRIEGNLKVGHLALLARPFVDAVAEPTATPGGGSVSAFAAALAAALGQMVAGLSRKKKSQAPHVEKLSEHLDALRNEADALAQAIDHDAASYDAVMAAFRLAQGDAGETQQREDAIQKATRGAAEVPLGVAERAVALFERLKQLETIAAASMKSDLQVARLMAMAGAQGPNTGTNLYACAGAVKRSARVIDANVRVECPAHRNFLVRRESRTRAVAARRPGFRWLRFERGSRCAKLTEPAAVR